jgi:23S rRNA (guanine745-N1)-methyltransferase
LRCPRCERDLVSAGPATWSLSCSEGHSFDANKRGYLSLVDRSRGITGDTREILAAREVFLNTGHYSPIVELLDDVVPTTPGASILDSGCGTGYYLAALLVGRPGWDALALDVSVDAVVTAVRATGAVGVVTDVWRPLPVRTERADVLLCVFAPRNPGEFARVLRPGGRLIVVTPAEHHLRELRETGAMIGIQPDKTAKLDQALGDDFELEERRSVEYTAELRPTELVSLAGMGPTGHHEARAGAAGDTGATTTVSIAVDASVYLKRG